ncbi:MAG TPA: hypothetical protein VEU07_01530 [Candidatus Acidoferrum sp.]|nr:hypothetical protein [Candidatus Acidoferrum sp.]
MDSLQTGQDPARPRNGLAADPTRILHHREDRTLQREEMVVENLTVQGWYRGFITLPAGGRLLDFLNTKPSMIALTGVRDPSGSHHSFLTVNSDQVLAIRPGVQE